MKKYTTLKLSPEVSNTLQHYNSQIESALEATQKLHNIAISMRLADMFWVSEENAAKMIQKDYLTQV